MKKIKVNNNKIKVLKFLRYDGKVNTREKYKVIISMYMHKLIHGFKFKSDNRIKENK